MTYADKVIELTNKGFTYWHARLLALQELNIISENCPEPHFWHYHVNKPDELPDEFKAIHTTFDRTNVWENYDWTLRKVQSPINEATGRDSVAYVDDTIYYP